MSTLSAVETAELLRTEGGIAPVVALGVGIAVGAAAVAVWAYFFR